MKRFDLVFVAALSAGIVACSGDHPASPSDTDENPDEIPGFTISNVVSAGTASAAIAASRAAGGTAYVSAAPHTFSDEAKFASITNETSGVARTSSPIVEGGFDPVKLDGDEGDSVSVALFTGSGGLLSVVYTKIPPRRPPRVVRTSPGKGRVDIAFNIVIEVVFTEPVDKASVTPASVRLMKGQVAVAGSLTVSADGLVARFAPAGNLDASTTYSLVLTQTLRDLDGEPLDDPPVVEFVTASAPSGSILVTVETVSVSGAATDADGYSLQLDSLPPEHVEPVSVRRFDVSGAVHSVGLTGMSDNCSEAESRRSVSISSGTTTTVQFQVRCTPPPPLEGKLVFLSERDGNAEIYTSNADGTGIRRLTNNSVAEFDPEWSPDGKRIAFARSRNAEGPSDVWPPFIDIYIMDADGSNVIRLTEAGTNYHPVWSPDGRRIAYVYLKSGGGTGIRILSLDNPGAARVQVGFNMGWNEDPAWSPDGQDILFASDWFFFDGPTVLFLARADGSQTPRVFLAASALRSAYLLQPSWSPDGSRIAFAACDWFYICWGPGAIAVYGPGTDYARLVETSHIESTTWSPDGSYIAYSSQGCRLCAPPSISYVSVDGTRQGLIISNAFSPSWGPSIR